MLRIVLLAVIAATLMLLGPTFVVRAHAETGIASYYGPGFHGHKTSSGERFNQWGATCAVPLFRAGRTKPYSVRVTHLGNGRSVICRVNDRMAANGRVIDVSKGIAERLNMLHSGVAHVRIEVVK